MEEVFVKTHLIVTDVHSEYEVRWCGRLAGCSPVLQNGRPLFAIVSSKGRMELATVDMKQLENCAKSLTQPKGRGKVSEDTVRIYLKETTGRETLMGVVVHRRVKEYAPMFDKVGWRE